MDKVIDRKKKKNKCVDSCVKYTNTASSQRPTKTAYQTATPRFLPQILFSRDTGIPRVIGSNSKYWAISSQTIIKKIKKIVQYCTITLEHLEQDSKFELKRFKRCFSPLWTLFFLIFNRTFVVHMLFHLIVFFRKFYLIESPSTTLGTPKTRGLWGCCEDATNTQQSAARTATRSNDTSNTSDNTTHNNSNNKWVWLESLCT